MMRTLIRDIEIDVHPEAFPPDEYSNPTTAPESDDDSDKDEYLSDPEEGQGGDDN